MSSTQHEVVLKLEPWDVMPSYSLVGNSVLGIIQVLCGLLSMALGVGAICTWASGYYIAYGIWCGFMYTVTGGICIGAARHKNVCLITSTMVLSIICVCLGIIQFSLGVVAASNDQPSQRHDIVSNQYAAQLLDYDIYYLQNSPLTYVCAGQNYGLSWRYAWGPVDVLLLLTGFFEFVTAVISIAFCCQVVFCGQRSRPLLDQSGHTGTIAYQSEAGYPTDTKSKTPSYSNYL